MKTSCNNRLLEIKNMTVRFEPQNLPPEELLKNVSLYLNKGSIHFLLGGNGTGKTSLLKTLMGLLPENTRSNEKTIYLPNGKILNGIELPKHLKIGYIPQHPHEALIPSFNVSENITFRTFLRNKVGVKEWFIKQRYNKKLDTLITRSVETFGVTKKLLSDKLHSGITHLSGGEQQILNLAAMVFDKCDLLIMDEPTSKLDRQNKLNFWELIEEIKCQNSQTMLIVTHDVLANDKLRLADSIFQVESGNISNKKIQPSLAGGG